MSRILAIVSVLGLVAGAALAQPTKRDQFERIPGVACRPFGLAVLQCTASGTV